MKIISANNSNKFEFNNQDWFKIKKAQGSSGVLNTDIGSLSPESNYNSDPDYEFGEDLKQLNLIKENTDTDTQSEFTNVRNPSSPSGTKIVSDGKSITRTYTAYLNGSLRIPPSVLETEGDIVEEVEKKLTEEIKEYGKENVIPVINDDIIDLWGDFNSDTELINVAISVTSFDNIESNRYQVSFTLEYSTIEFVSESELGNI